MKNILFIAGFLLLMTACSKSVSTPGGGDNPPPPPPPPPATEASIVIPSGLLNAELGEVDTVGIFQIVFPVDHTIYEVGAKAYEDTTGIYDNSKGTDLRFVIEGNGVSKDIFPPGEWPGSDRAKDAVFFKKGTYKVFVLAKMYDKNTFITGLDMA